MVCLFYLQNIYIRYIMIVLSIKKENIMEKYKLAKANVATVLDDFSNTKRQLHNTINDIMETDIVSSCCDGRVDNLICVECGEHCDEIDLNKLTEVEEMLAEDYQR